MNDFTKQKIAFAVGLLAVLFTVTPLLQPFGEVGFSLFGARLTLLRLYYFLSIILMLATYAYATQFLTERDLRYPAVIGNSLYAAAMVAPPLYVVLFALSYIRGYLAPLLNSSVAESILWVVTVVAGACSFIFTAYFERSLGRKEKKAAAARLEQEEMQFLKRAEDLNNAGHYDLAVVEAWKAIEVAIRRTLLGRNIPTTTRGAPYREIERHKVLPGDLLGDFHRIRQIRNNAAHAIEPTSKEQAEKVIALTGRILAALTDRDNDSEDIE